jgi:hypothetical protein
MGNEEEGIASSPRIATRCATARNDNYIVIASDQRERGNLILAKGMLSVKT